MTVNNANDNIPLSHADASMRPHSTVTHTHPVTKTLAWLKWKGLGPGAQMNCLYKTQNKHSMSGDLTRAHQLHTALGIPSNLTIHLSFSLPLHPSSMCSSPDHCQSISYVVLFVILHYAVYIQHVRVNRLHERVSIFSHCSCSALSESGHAVSGWWWRWLSNVRMSPESGNCDWFLFLCQWCLACSFLSTLHYRCCRFLFFLYFWSHFKTSFMQADSDLFI